MVSPRFNPFFIPKMIADIAPGQISIKHNLQGPNFTTVSACASSANSIIDSLNYIRLGLADVFVTGGSEAAVAIAGMGGFNAMHALSTRNDDPKTASRPFDKDRDGFVLGEGAGALILEELGTRKSQRCQRFMLKSLAVDFLQMLITLRLHILKGEERKMSCSTV